LEDSNLFRYSLSSKEFDLKKLKNISYSVMEKIMAHLKKNDENNKDNEFE